MVEESDDGMGSENGGGAGGVVHTNTGAIVSRPRIYEEDLQYKKINTVFKGQPHTVPVVITAYGDILYGEVASIKLSTGNVKQAQMTLTRCVKRCPDLAHNDKKIGEDLQVNNVKYSVIGIQ
jgi:hypothetical protein